MTNHLHLLTSKSCSNGLNCKSKACYNFMFLQNFFMNHFKISLCRCNQVARGNLDYPSDLWTQGQNWDKEVRGKRRKEWIKEGEGEREGRERTDRDTANKKVKMSTEIKVISSQCNEFWVLPQPSKSEKDMTRILTHTYAHTFTHTQTNIKLKHAEAATHCCLDIYI